MTRYIDLTSAELKAARKAQGLNQTELGKRAGFARGAVSYWENRRGQLWSSPALDKMLDVLGLEHLKYYRAPNARARPWGFTDPQQEVLDRKSEKEIQRLTDRVAREQSRERVRCNAKTRAGHPCKHMSEAGRKRCKFHGGMSTGPRTKAGRARVAEAQRLRWQRYREAHLYGLGVKCLR